MMLHTKRMRWLRAFCCGVGLAAVASTADGVCIGDCDHNGVVSVDELVRAVNIALNSLPLTDCESLDRDRNHIVSVDELVAAVNAALGGCPPVDTPTASPTATPTETNTPINQPPVILPALVYRTYPGYPIALALPARDPEGGALDFMATTLPDGAHLDQMTGMLTWTPAAEQLGPFVVDFTATDHGVPPKSADGVQSFVVAPLDQCTIPSCIPAYGCDSQIIALATSCCAGGPGPRIDEPPPVCPGGRVVFAGRNTVDNSTGTPMLPNGFGRLVNCDQLRVASGSQGGGTLFLNVEARCLNTDEPVRVHVRIDTAAMSPVIDQDALVLTPLDSADGYARWQARFAVGSTAPPDGTEGNLTVSIADTDGTKVVQQLRLVFTPNALPDLPE